VKIAYVSSCDWEGQRFNGIVLHRVLNRIGRSSDFAAADCSLKDEGVQCIGGPVLRFLSRVAGKAERRLSLQSILPILGLSLSCRVHFRQVDLVHWSRVLHAWGELPAQGGVS
jgi:hypothetical protein